MKLIYNVEIPGESRKQKRPNDYVSTLTAFLAPGQSVAEVNHKRHGKAVASVYQSFFMARKRIGCSVNIVKRGDRLFLVQEGGEVNGQS